MPDKTSPLPNLLAARAKPLWRSEAASYAPPATPVLRLGGGVPDPAALPIAELEEACRLVLEREGNDALQYGGPQGYNGLREALAERIGREDGMELNALNFMLTGGAAQALAAVCFTFLDPGDTVVSEDPTFPGSIRAFRAHEASLVGVPLEDEGLDIAALERTLGEAQAAGDRVKLLYLTPNSQNPTAITFSLARREAIVHLATRFGCLIVEDDAYGDIRFDGDALPSLFSLAGGEGVIRLGTFSKTIGPGLRLGWTQADPDITRVLTSMRLDMGISPFLSRVVAEFSAGDRFEHHVAKLNAFCKEKRDAMAKLLEEHCRDWAEWQVPSGGFFFWLKLVPRLNPDELAKVAYEEGVSVSSGNGFFCGRPTGNFLRVAFSYVASEEMAGAVTRLDAAARRLLGSGEGLRPQPVER